jgi:hypothetical protein
MRSCSPQQASAPARSSPIRRWCVSAAPSAPTRSSGARASLDNDVVVGARVRIQSNVYMTGYGIVEDDVFVGPCVKRPTITPWAATRRASRCTARSYVAPAASAAPQCCFPNRDRRGSLRRRGSGRDRHGGTAKGVIGVPAHVLRNVADEDLLKTGADRRASALGGPASPRAIHGPILIRRAPSCRCCARRPTIPRMRASCVASPYDCWPSTTCMSCGGPSAPPGRPPGDRPARRSATPIRLYP